MWQITQEQLNTINFFLDHQGLTFKPLREEMLDHMLGDIEAQMDAGNAFEDAFSIISKDIPDNHFKQIQNETMEAINKRFTVARAFSILSIVLLICTSIFKVLHLPGTVIMLILSILSMAISLVVSSLSGIILYKEKQGGLLLMCTVAAIILFFFSWSFLVLQLPGAIPLKIISVSILLILFPSLTLYFNSKPKANDSILIFLHKKHSPGIERFLYIVLFLSIAMIIAANIFEYPPDISRVLLILVIGGSGLQYFALNWHFQITNEKNTDRWIQGALILAFACFMLPALGAQLNFTLRVILSAAFYIIAGIISISRTKDIKYRALPFIYVGIITVISVLFLLIQLSILDESTKILILNLPVLIILFSGLFVFRKYSIFRTYMFIVFAYYLFEYLTPLGQI